MILSIGTNKYMHLGFNNDPTTTKLLDIAFIGACFKKRNAVIIRINTHSSFPYTEWGYIFNALKQIRHQNPKQEIYFIANGTYASKNFRQWLKTTLLQLHRYIGEKPMKRVCPERYYHKQEMEWAVDFYQNLLKDDSFILKHIEELHKYQQTLFTLGETERETAVFKKELEKIEKERCENSDDSIIGFDELAHLGLMQSVEKEGAFLKLHLKPLVLKTSLPLGRIYPEETLATNPVLFTLLQHLYAGADFMIPETVITINSEMTPYFQQYKGDYISKFMINKANWSGLGFPHMGDRSTCYGEFNDFIARGKKYNLLYYFLGLKSFLTTMNSVDTAGRRSLFYDVYYNNEYVYNAGVEVLRLSKRFFKESPGLDHITFRKKLADEWNAIDTDVVHMVLNDYGVPEAWRRCGSGGEDNFLKYLDTALKKGEIEKEMYEKIQERRER